MSKGIYAPSAERGADGQGSPHRSLVSRDSFVSRGSVKALGGPLCKPGTKLAVEHHGHPPRTVHHVHEGGAIVQIRCLCGGLILVGGFFPLCESCGKQPGWDKRVQVQGKETARESTRAAKRFMKATKGVE